MRNIALVTLVFLAFLPGCSPEKQGSASSDTAVGTDKDEHGCIGSAGYIWCARNKECVRPWELAEKIGFDNSAGNVKDYCDG